MTSEHSVSHDSPMMTANMLLQTLRNMTSNSVRAKLKASKYPFERLGNTLAALSRYNPLKPLWMPWNEKISTDCQQPAYSGCCLIFRFLRG